MAAIDFPSNPTTGQTVTVGNRVWTWDGSVWESDNARQFVRTVSDTAPSNPFVGDEWFNSATGRLYTYYDSYWIEIGASLSGQNGTNGTDGADGADASLTRNIRTVTASTSLQSGDMNQIVRFNGTSSQVLTVNDVLSVGSSVEVVQDNSGSVELQSGAGVTLLSSNGMFVTKGQNSVVTIRCLASGQYRVTGDLASLPTVTGGTLTSDSTYYYRTFTGSGSLVVANAGLSVDILAVAGGGSGGAGTGGGGGAGGLIYIESYPLFASTYTVTIGAGGTNDDVGVGTSGVNTSVSNGTRTLTALGGGAGGATETNNVTFAASSGGSGGGAQNYYPSNGNTTPGSATQPSTTSDGVSSYLNTGFGNAGSGGVSGGSGGGGGGAGASASSGSPNGGAGKQLSISGTSSWYAAGGSGGNGGTTSTNGIGGYFVDSSGTNAVANTGSGGGGGWNHDSGYGGAGGSGIVIVRYLKTAVA